MNDSLLQKSAMKCLIDNFGNVEAERFISLVIKEPFDYTKWQETLYEGMSVEELSKKAMGNRLAKKKATNNE